MVIFSMVLLLWNIACSSAYYSWILYILKTQNVLGMINEDCNDKRFFNRNPQKAGNT